MAGRTALRCLKKKRRDGSAVEIFFYPSELALACASVPRREGRRSLCLSQPSIAQLNTKASNRPGVCRYIDAALLQAKWWLAQRRRSCRCWQGAPAFQACHHLCRPRPATGPKLWPASTAHNPAPHDDHALPRRPRPAQKHHPATRSKTFFSSYTCSR